MKSYNILLTGVGGQGLMLLSQILGDACTSKDYPVVVGAQHGLAQRSGSISAHVRMGDVYSPLIPYGSADMIIAMEGMEALRYIEYLKEGGVIVMNSRIMHPPLETAPIVKNRQEKKEYITIDQIFQQLKKVTNKIISLDANLLALEAGNPRTENIVLLGAASTQKDFPLDSETLTNAIKRNVPEKTIEANLKALEIGRRQAEI
ncbi:indolepyruvate ferredoxin oxidoreductase subunit beta [Candidatus Bathyarchaeota archaeon]|nr:indolepyruvate ferredoxin oxidoreductase subunit beta [Candidatus Bathyarchaeota archaeon]